eukprot:INCI4096.1.p1 GENE.INCI4096.1~~INCI4096.1.p1  ORF type:complete len:270 (+),score=-12.44 INCI4096.1:123-812(+)
MAHPRSVPIFCVFEPIDGSRLVPTSPDIRGRFHSQINSVVRNPRYLLHDVGRPLCILLVVVARPFWLGHCGPNLRLSGSSDVATKRPIAKGSQTSTAHPMFTVGLISRMRLSVCWVPISIESKLVLQACQSTLLRLGHRERLALGRSRIQTSHSRLASLWAPIGAPFTACIRLLVNFHLLVTPGWERQAAVMPTVLATRTQRLGKVPLHTPQLIQAGRHAMILLSGLHA